MGWPAMATSKSLTNLLVTPPQEDDQRESTPLPKRSKGREPMMALLNFSVTTGFFLEFPALIGFTQIDKRRIPVIRQWEADRGDDH